MIDKLIAWVYNWALGVKDGEDGARTDTYYLQEWE